MESSDLKEQQTCLFQDDSFADIGARLKWQPTREGARWRESLDKDEGFRLRVNVKQSENSDQKCDEGGQKATIYAAFNQPLMLLTQDPPDWDSMPSSYLRITELRLNFKRLTGHV